MYEHVGVRRIVRIRVPNARITGAQGLEHLPYSDDDRIVMEMCVPGIRCDTFYLRIP